MNQGHADISGFQKILMSAKPLDDFTHEKRTSENPIKQLEKNNAAKITRS